MARSTAEIEAEIALTRRQIEVQLDGLGPHLPRHWWTPYAVLAGALLLGTIASRVPIFKLVGFGARAVQTGLTLASVVATVDRFIAEHRPVAPPERKRLTG